MMTLSEAVGRQIRVRDILSKVNVCKDGLEVLLGHSVGQGAILDREIQITYALIHNYSYFAYENVIITWEEKWTLEQLYDEIPNVLLREKDYNNDALIQDWLHEYTRSQSIHKFLHA
jgi:hypothetical protein